MNEAEKGRNASKVFISDIAMWLAIRTDRIVPGIPESVVSEFEVCCVVVSSGPLATISTDNVLYHDSH